MADSMTMDVSNLTAEQCERMMVAVHEAEGCKAADGIEQRVASVHPLGN